jgi:hypothetical protein
MKKITVFAFCLVFLSAFVFSYQEEEYYAYSFARLNYVNGDVYIQRAEDQGYEEGTVNLPLVQGDKLGTRDGRAEIHFGKKNYLRIDHYTQIDFVRLPQRGDEVVSIHLLSGNIYLRINSMDREKDFEVHSPDGSFYILEEGLYRFEVKDDRETVTYVAEGSVEAAGEEGSELIRSGESLVTANGFFSSGPNYSYASYEDGFSEWNRGRDILHNRYVRRSYLPSELYDYEAELAYYGQWVYERPYGYVWIPDVYHYTWRPYYNGRWTWYPICGWTWISYEPWGWCVSHYGRWHWRVGLGWYWIPTRYWGPAWVHWYSGYDYIGWCPLNYYNRPVVIVNNTFYGNYSDRYYPAHSRALTVVHKNQLSARHIPKVALSSSSVTRLDKISLSSSQPKIRPTSNHLSLKNSPAAKTLSRSSLRQVTKNYSSGTTARSSLNGNRTNPARTTQRTIGSRTLSENALSSSRKIETSRARSSLSEKSVGTTGRSQISGTASSRSGIKVYPSRGGSYQRTSGINSSQSRFSPSSRNTRITPSSSPSTAAPQSVRRYPSQSSSVSERKIPVSEQARKYSSSSTDRSYRPFIRYPSSSNYSTKSRSSSSYRLPSSSSTRSLSYQPKSYSRSSYGRSPYSYSTPSRSDSRIRSSSTSYKSFSPRSVTPSRSSSSVRSFKSPSRVSVTRSSPARSSSASRSTSRSGTKSRVRKK